MPEAGVSRPFDDGRAHMRWVVRVDPVGRGCRGLFAFEEVKPHLLTSNADE